MHLGRQMETGLAADIQQAISQHLEVEGELAI